MAGSDLPRILLVDDEQDLLDGLRRQLRREFDVETAVGAANGLFSLGKGAPFEVIVSDFMMPGINGAQFLTAARKARRPRRACCSPATRTWPTRRSR